MEAQAQERVSNHELYDRMLRVRHESWELYSDLIEQLGRSLMSEVALKNNLELPGIIGVEQVRQQKKFWDFQAVAMTSLPDAETAYGDHLKCWIMLDGLWVGNDQKLVMTAHAQFDGVKQSDEGLQHYVYTLGRLERWVFKQGGKP